MAGKETRKTIADLKSEFEDHGSALVKRFPSPEILGKEMSCSVCWEIVEPPAFFCKDGHIICEKDLKNGGTCMFGEKVKCQKDIIFVNLRPMYYEYLYNNAIIECRNKVDGCNALVLGVDLKKHEASCLFRKSSDSKLSATSQSSHSAALINPSGSPAVKPSNSAKFEPNSSTAIKASKSGEIEKVILKPKSSVRVKQNDSAAPGQNNSVRMTTIDSESSVAIHSSNNSIIEPDSNAQLNQKPKKLLNVNPAILHAFGFKAQKAGETEYFKEDKARPVESKSSTNQNKPKLPINIQEGNRASEAKAALQQQKSDQDNKSLGIKIWRGLLDLKADLQNELWSLSGEVWTSGWKFSNFDSVDEHSFRFVSQDIEFIVENSDTIWKRLTEIPSIKRFGLPDRVARRELHRFLAIVEERLEEDETKRSILGE